MRLNLLDSFIFLYQAHQVICHRAKLYIHNLPMFVLWNQFSNEFLIIGTEDLYIVGVRGNGGNIIPAQI